MKEVQRMDSLLKLYKNAEEEGIEIVDFPLSCSKAMILKFQDICAIALDHRKIKTKAEEKVCLAHELGHYNTGTFYNTKSSPTNITKCEAKANKWAICELVPLDELIKASKSCKNYYELAEYFEVTESFIKMAVEYYERIGVLSVESEN